MRIAIVVLLLALPLLPLPASAGGFVLCRHSAPRAACVVDGDTFWLNHEKIRPMGYDAPEMGEPLCSGPAPGAKAARARLLELLNGGGVDIARAGHDKYGRTLAHVRIGGSDLAQLMIGAGLGRHYVAGQRPWC